LAAWGPKEPARAGHQGTRSPMPGSLRSRWRGSLVGAVLDSALFARSVLARAFPDARSEWPASASCGHAPRRHTVVYPLRWLPRGSGLPRATTPAHGYGTAWPAAFGGGRGTSRRFLSGCGAGKAGGREWGGAVGSGPARPGRSLCLAGAILAGANEGAGPRWPPRLAARIRTAGGRGRAAGRVGEARAQWHPPAEPTDVRDPRG